MIKLLTNQPNKIRCHDKAFWMSSQSMRGSYEAVTIRMKPQTPGQLTTALQTLDEEIRRFKSCLATVELKREGQPEPQRFEFDEASQLDLPTIMKAA